MYQAGEEQDHIPPFVHDRAVTERTPDLAGKLVLDALVGRVVPFKIVMAVRKVDVVLVEDGSPLEWCGYCVDDKFSKVSQQRGNV